jgi:hypothetical protein
MTPAAQIALAAIDLGSLRRDHGAVVHCTGLTGTVCDSDDAKKSLTGADKPCNFGFAFCRP